MLDHVSIGVSDLARSRPFWVAALGALGIGPVIDRIDKLGFGTRNRPGDDGHCYLTLYVAAAPVVADRKHWAFRADSRAAVRAFHAAGLSHGGRCDGPPGLRDYHDQYFAAFLLDPDGHRIEAVCHRAE